MTFSEGNGYGPGGVVFWKYPGDSSVIPPASGQNNGRHDRQLVDAEGHATLYIEGQKQRTAFDKNVDKNDVRKPFTTFISVGVERDSPMAVAYGVLAGFLPSVGVPLVVNHMVTKLYLLEFVDTSWILDWRKPDAPTLQVHGSLEAAAHSGCCDYRSTISLPDTSIVLGTEFSPGMLVGDAIVNGVVTLRVSKTSPLPGCSGQYSGPLIFRVTAFLDKASEKVQLRAESPPGFSFIDGSLVNVAVPEISSCDEEMQSFKPMEVGGSLIPTVDGNGSLTVGDHSYTYSPGGTRGIDGWVYTAACCPVPDEITVNYSLKLTE